MGSKVTSLMVANLSTTSAYCDYFLVELYADSGYTTMIDSKRIDVVKSGNNYVQKSAVIFGNLIQGTQYYLRGYVVAPVSGKKSSVLTYATGTGQQYSPTGVTSFNGTFTTTISGVDYTGVTPVGDASNVVAYELTYTKGTATPPGDMAGYSTRATAPFDYFAGGLPGDEVRAYCRVVTRTGQKGNWLALNGAISVADDMLDSVTGSFIGSVADSALIAGVPAGLLVKQAQIVWQDSFESFTLGDTGSWEALGSEDGTNLTFPANGQAGGKVIHHSAATKCWFTFKYATPFEPNRLYKITVRVRKVSGANNTTFSCGVEGIGANGTTLVDRNGSTNHANMFFVAAQGVNVPSNNTWQEYNGYFKGTGTYTAPSSNCNSPAPLHANVRYFRPVFFMNAENGGDTWEIDIIAIAMMPLSIGDFPGISDGTAGDINGGTPTSGTQLLRNFDFENGMDFWQGAVGGEDLQIITSYTNAHSGNKYLQVTCASGDCDTLQVDGYGAVKWFAVVPGQRLEFGGWLYREYGNGYATVGCSICDKDKANIRYVNNDQTTTGVWTNAATTIDVGTGEKYIAVYIAIKSASTSTRVRFDDLYLKIIRDMTNDVKDGVSHVRYMMDAKNADAKTPSNSQNMLKNYTFDDNLVYWCQYGNQTGNTWYHRTDANKAYSGTKYVELVTGASGGNSNLYPADQNSNAAPIQVLVGKTYYLVAYVYLETSSGTGCIAINGYDKTDTYVNSSTTGTTTTQSAWVMITTTYTVPANVCWIRPAVYISGTNQIMRVDNVELCPITSMDDPRIGFGTSYTKLSVNEQAVFFEGNPTTSTQLLLNGDFQKGSANWGFTQGTGGGSVAVVTDAGEAHTGDKYLKIIGAASGGQVAQSYNSGSNTPRYIKVVPGEQFTLKAWGYLVSGTNGRIWADFVNYAVSNIEGYCGPMSWTSTGAWSQKTVTATVPANAYWARVFVDAANTASTFRADDIELVRLSNVVSEIVGEVPKLNLLPNGTFANGALVLNGWSYYNAAYCSSSLNGTYTVNGKTYTSTELITSGGAGGIYYTLKVKPYTKYSYAGVVYNNGATNSMLWVGSTDWTTCYSQTTAVAIPYGSIGELYKGHSAHTYNSVCFVGGASRWELKSGTFTVPTGVSAINFMLYNTGSSATSYWFAPMFWEGDKWQDYNDGEPLAGSVNFDTTVVDGASFIKPAVSTIQGIHQNPTSSTNLLFNGGFENGLSGWTASAIGWTGWTLVTNSTNARTGNKYLQFSGANAGQYPALMNSYNGTPATGAAAYRWIEVIPGEIFEIEAFTWVETIGSGAGVYAVLAWYDKDKTLISSTNASRTSTNTSWYQLKVAYTMPSTTKYLLAYLMTYPNGNTLTARFDDVSLCKVASNNFKQTTPNEVTYAGYAGTGLNSSGQITQGTANNNVSALNSGVDRANATINASNEYIGSFRDTSTSTAYSNNNVAVGQVRARNGFDGNYKLDATNSGTPNRSVSSIESVVGSDSKAAEVYQSSLCPGVRTGTGRTAFSKSTSFSSEHYVGSCKRNVSNLTMALYYNTNQYATIQLIRGGSQIGSDIGPDSSGVYTYSETAGTGTVDYGFKIKSSGTSNEAIACVSGQVAGF